MNEDHEPASPSDFDKRLKQALARRGEGGSKPSDDSGGSPRSGLSIALRIGIELVAALMVGPESASCSTAGWARSHG